MMLRDVVCFQTSDDGRPQSWIHVNLPRTFRVGKSLDGLLSLCTFSFALSDGNLLMRRNHGMLHDDEAKRPPWRGTWHFATGKTMASCVSARRRKRDFYQLSFLAHFLLSTIHWNGITVARRYIHKDTNTNRRSISRCGIGKIRLIVGNIVMPHPNRHGRCCWLSNDRFKHTSSHMDQSEFVVAPLR
jgi:hypothetical protein